jgi:hypothetical protein
MGEFTFRPTVIAPTAMDLYVDLFRTCFPAEKQYSREFLLWQYTQNPDGEAVGTDAFVGPIGRDLCLPPL